MTDKRLQAIETIAPFRTATRWFDGPAVQTALADLMEPGIAVHLANPFETLAGPAAFFETALAPLANALTGIERRETIVMAGADAHGDWWVGCCGYYCGTFENSFLDIPPTGHMATMRFHEFYKVADGHISEFQGMWDIPELMHQAGVWPMAPQLGHPWYAPGPATQDGLAYEGRKDSDAKASFTLVDDMLTGLGKFAAGGVEAMALDKYWHPHLSWYGPFGIGTCRRIDGFRNWHQIPFLNALPDRTGGNHPGGYFADGNYVAVTGWPNMQATVTGDGWLGITPAGQKITMRSLDFWRCENGQICENWVLVDILGVYAQLGVDVFARMREMTKARRS
ncbi:MAG: ester cyclase [Pseudomonadota bacterium]